MVRVFTNKLLVLCDLPDNFDVSFDGKTRLEDYHSTGLIR